MYKLLCNRVFKSFLEKDFTAIYSALYLNCLLNLYVEEFGVGSPMDETNYNFMTKFVVL